MKFGEFYPTLSDAEDGETMPQDTIGLYRQAEDIPEGNWGYIIDESHQRGFYGPLYNRASDQELPNHTLWREFDDLVQAGNYDPRLAEFLGAAKDKESASRYISVARDF